MAKPLATDPDTGEHVAAAYRVWNCGRCDSELVTNNDYLVCETCGSFFSPSNNDTADYVGNEYPDDDR